jgi:hypothetical protein
MDLFFGGHLLWIGLDEPNNEVPGNSKTLKAFEASRRLTGYLSL